MLTLSRDKICFTSLYVNLPAIITYVDLTVKTCAAVDVYTIKQHLQSKSMQTKIRNPFL